MIYQMKVLRVLLLLLVFHGPIDKLNAQGSLKSLKTVEFARIADFRHIPQTQSNWCWAATLAEVINATRGTDLIDCDVASQYFSQPCCRYPYSCNSQNSLFEFYDIVRRYNLNTKIHYRISWETLTEELKNSRPVLIRIESPLGQGHFVTIMGYDYSIYQDTGNIRRSIILSDPMYGYFVGDRDLIGYGVTWEELIRGELFDYNARWTHTVLFTDL